MFARLGSFIVRKGAGGGAGLAARSNELPQFEPAVPPVATLAFDPALYAPPGSRPVILTDYWASPAAVGSNAPALLSRRVEKGWVHVVDSIEVFADGNPVSVTRAKWSIRIDGVVVPGGNDFTMMFRSATSLSKVFSGLRISAPTDRLVDVLISNIDGAARTFGAQLTGWTYRPGGV